MVDTSVLEADIARCKSSSLFWGTKHKVGNMAYGNYSRGPDLDLEKCVENMGNSRFMMIIIASARVREIANKNKHSVRLEHRHPVITALKEVESGELTLSDVQKIK